MLSRDVQRLVNRVAKDRPSRKRRRPLSDLAALAPVSGGLGTAGPVERVTGPAAP